MSREYKKRIKEQYGRPVVLGTDVLNVSAVQISGVAPTVLLAAGINASGVNGFVMPKPGFVDFIVANVSPPLAANGVLNVALSKNGVVVASGSMNSAQPSRFEAFFSAKYGSEVSMASGDVLQVSYSVPTALSGAGSTQQGYRALNARVGLEYRDA